MRRKRPGGRGSRPNWTRCGNGCAAWVSLMTRSPPRSGDDTRARPREAFRLAWGWTLEQAAARFNGHAATRDADPEARASLTSSRLSEYEHWPRSTRKPSAYVLAMLAEIYETDVLCLLDLSDHESLPQQDRLVLMRRPRAETLCRPRAQVVADDDEPGNAAVSRLVSGGLWLSLPYVPGRLVIEVSGPAGDTAQLAGCADGDTVAGGRLVLLRGAGAGEAGTEAAGA